MPSWKKVITSGSDAILNSVIATGSLNTINRELIYNGQTVLDWDLHQLAANGVPSVEWDARQLFSSDASVAADWANRLLTYDNGNTAVYWNTGELVTNNDEVTLNWLNRYLRDDAGIEAVNWEHKSLNAFNGATSKTSINWASRSLYNENDKAVLYWSGSDQLILSASNLYAKGLITGSTSNVLTYNPTTGQVYYTASAALGGGGGPESDPIFTAWSGSAASRFAGTSSFALTASLAPNYVLNTATSSFVLNSQTSSMTVLSSSFALTASYVQNALTASFVTSSNVFGPYGRNSVISASYALTASYIANVSAGGNDTEIQFNSNGILAGTSSLLYYYASQSIVHGQNNRVRGQYNSVFGQYVTMSNNSTYSQAIGYNTSVDANYAHAEGSGSAATAQASHAEGVDTLAKKVGSHAEGLGTLANAPYQLTIGRYNSDIEANGDGAFIIGNGTSTAARSNFFEVVPDLNYMSSSGDFYNKEDVYFPGLPTTGSLPFVGIRPSDGRLYRVGKIVLGTGGVAVGSDAISGGKDTSAIGDQGFSIGDTTTATGTNAVSTGKDTTAVGSGTLTTGDTTTAVGDNSVATGKDTIAAGTSSLATGKSTVASGSNSVATGRDTIASGSNSLTAGSGSKADAENSVAFGKGTIASKEEQVVIGRYNTADTQSLFVVGAGTNDTNRKTIMKVDTAGARIDGTFIISGSSTFTNIGPAVFSGSIAQESNTATGTRAVALGFQSEASGLYSVAYGNQTTALGNYSFAGGTNTVASGTFAVALGAYTYAAQNASLAFGGFSRTEGLYSIAAGFRVTASANYQTVIGKDNIELSDIAAFIIGNGSNNTNRSNLLVASGDIVQITGSLQVTAGITGSLLGTAATASYVLNAVSSSFAATASFVNRLNQNVIVTGSVNISGSVTATSFTGSLRGHITTSSIDTREYKLINSAGVTQVNWETGVIGHPDTRSIDWVNKQLLAAGNTVAVDWANRNLLTSGSVLGLDWSDDTVSRARVYQRQELTTVKAESLSSTAYTYSGQAIEFSGYIHGSCVVGNLVYLGTDGTWRAVDAASGNSAYLLGIYLGTNSVLLEGDVVIDEVQNIDSPAPGRPVYFLEGDTTGMMSTTIPTSGIVRVVGHCYWNNVDTQSKNWILKFRPSNDWYEI
jgi:hypothetical protein